MRCPHCRGDACRRSRRRGLHEYVFSLAGVYPWRCRDCERRFYAALVSLRHVFYAHCPHCGSFGLERISGAALEARFGFTGRLPFVSRFRCHPCRCNFSSLRPFRASLANAPSAPAESAAAGGKGAL